MYLLFYFVAIIVHFDKSFYSVAEHDGSVQPILTLSKPSPCHITIRVKARDFTATGKHTVYVKSFEGENFCGFHKFLLTANVLPLKIFLEYWHCPLTTQSMIPPGLKFSTAKVFPTY